MITLILNDKTSIHFVGDIHGEFSWLSKWIKEKDIKDSILIFCGDFGVGFDSVEREELELQSANLSCKERNIDCYVFRGNHDNPEYFTDKQKLNLSQFTLIRDYTIIKTPNHNILCVGGAVSVDRLNRISYLNERVLRYSLSNNISQEEARLKLIENGEYVGWWENEKFVYDDVAIEDIKKIHENIDVIATHSAPDFCQPTKKNNISYWLRVDPGLDSDLESERRDITKLYNSIKGISEIKYWFYGHFHGHYFENIEGTNFVGLDMDFDAYSLH